MNSLNSTGWMRPGPNARGLRVDAAVALVIAVSSPIVGLLYMRTGVYGPDSDYAAPWTWVVGIALASLPLALRRRYPITVALLVAAGFFVCGQFGVPDGLIIQIALFLAIYSVGAWGRNRRHALVTRFGITVAMLVWVVLNLVISSADEEMFPGMPRTGLFSAFATFAAIQILTNLLYFGAAIYLVSVPGRLRATKRSWKHRVASSRSNGRRAQSRPSPSTVSSSPASFTTSSPTMCP